MSQLINNSKLILFIITELINFTLGFFLFAAGLSLYFPLVNRRWFCKRFHVLTFLLIHTLFMFLLKNKALEQIGRTVQVLCYF